MTELIILIAAFLFSRTFLLTVLPIFNDEAMYLHWGQIFAADPSRWWVSLALDGKQPAMPVLLGTILRLPGDPLVLGRLVSVCFGLVTFLALYRAVKIAAKGQTAATAALLLICSPFLLEFDRLALMESAVVASAAVAYWAVVRWARQPSWLWGVAAGAAAAAGWWFKSTAELTLVTAIIAVIAVGRMRRIPVRNQAIFSLAMLAVYHLTTLPLRLHPMYARIPLREAERVTSVGDLLNFPFQLWGHNAGSAIAWLMVFASPVVALLFLYSLRYIRKDPVVMITWIYASVPIMIEALVSKVFTARYMVIAVPFIALSAAFVITRFAARWRDTVRFTAISIALVPSLILIAFPLAYYRMLRIAPPAQQDFGQYVLGFSSGYGIPDAVAYIKDRQAGRQAVVLVRADSGNPEDAVFTYLSREPNFRVDYEGTFLKNPQAFLTVTGGGPDIYFISRGSQRGGMAPYLTELARFVKPLDGEFVGVYGIDRSRLFAFR